MDSTLGGIERWHELFDELCRRSGHGDSMELAARYCSLTNANARNQFETAIRNLSNWRSGRHLPRLRSMRVLEQLLDIAADPQLQQRWNLLYQRAQLDEPEEGEPLADRVPAA